MVNGYILRSGTAGSRSGTADPQRHGADPQRHSRFMNRLDEFAKHKNLHTILSNVAYKMIFNYTSKAQSASTLTA